MVTSAPAFRSCAARWRRRLAALPRTRRPIGGVVVDRMLNGTGNIGFDAALQQYVDLYEAGIVDPVKVVRTAGERRIQSRACCC